MIRPDSGLALESKARDAISLAESYGSWEGIRTNHVVTSLGSFTGPDGSSRSISSETDLELMLALRRKAEVLVVDAKTARLEGYRAPKSNLMLVVASRSGNFEGLEELRQASSNVFFACGKPVSENHIQTGENPWASISEFFDQMGKHSLLVEAGPTLSRLAFEAGLVRQSALTITPQQPDSTTLNQFHPFDSSAKLASVAQSEEATFTLWTH